MNNDQFFDQIVREAPGARLDSAPGKLKSRLYTSLVRAQQLEGPLVSLTATKREGRELCVFEELVEIAPVGTAAKSAFCCTTCHARLLAEHLEHPPIWWP